jgi:hypothetical protein
MMDENLAENISFVLDAIIDDIDEPYTETLEAALILTQYSWNNEIQENYNKEGFYKTELKKLEDYKSNFWKQLIRNNAPSLIDILMERKMFFYPDDKRFVRNCFVNPFGTISVVEDNDEKTLHVQSRF